MIFARTLTFYVARRFLAATGMMLAALTLLVSLFDFIELLRRAATRPDAGFALVATIAALRLPFMGMQILPFAILLGGILAFWRLTRSSELIVARAAGVSAWGFLMGPVLVALLFGLVHGMGLSGALKEVGLPANHLPLALFGFNAGVDLGQLLVLLLAWGIFVVFGRTRWATGGRVACIYAIGAVSAFWTLDRVRAILV